MPLPFSFSLIYLIKFDKISQVLRFYIVVSRRVMLLNNKYSETGSCVSLIFGKDTVIKLSVWKFIRVCKEEFRLMELLLEKLWHVTFKYIISVSKYRNTPIYIKGCSFFYNQ